MNAPDIIALVRKTRPQVLELARSLAIAPAVDVNLVRNIRLARFPDAGVSLETDLWASPLVQTRSGPMLVLRADVQVELRDLLRRDRAELERSYRLLKAARSNVRPLQALEDEVTYLALKGDRAGVEDALNRVVKTIIDDAGRRADLAAWSARVLARLHDDLRDSDAARLLASISAGWVATPETVTALTPTPENARLASMLHPDAPKRRVGIRRAGSMLEVGDVRAPSVELDVPSANPVLIIDEQHTHRLEPTGVTYIPVTSAEIMLGTTDGKRWLLGPLQDVPSLAALSASFGRGGLTVAYLVAPQLAITSARSLSDERDPELTFGGERIRARVVTTDVDSDVAVLQLARAAPVAPVELAENVHAGERWRAYAVAGGIARTTSKRENASSLRWHGSVASVSPTLALNAGYDELPEALTRPGMPVFVGRKVIGHLDGQRRDAAGRLRAASARAIRKWIEQTNRAIEVQQMFIIVRASSQRLAEEAKAALATITSPGWQVWIDHAAAGAVIEEDIHSAVFARRASSTSRSMVIGIDTKLEPAATRLADSEVVVVRLTRTLDEAVDAVRRDIGAPLQKPQSRKLPNVWIHSRDADGAPEEIDFVGAANVQFGDLVVLFGGPTRRRRPTGLYRVSGGRRLTVGGSETRVRSSELRAGLVMRFDEPDDDARSALESLAETTSTRDTRNLNIHERLTELLALVTPVERQDELFALVGTPAGYLAQLAQQVAIHLPERVVVEGLLGAVIAQQDDRRVVRRYGWYEHPVVLAVGRDNMVADSIRVDVRVETVATLDRELDVAASPSRGVVSLLEACERVAIQRQLIPWPRYPRNSSYDVEVVVPRLPTQPIADALRRGIRFVTAVLAEMDLRSFSVRSLFARVAGIGTLDLIEAQHRLAGTDPNAPIRILSIDPETDLVELVMFGPENALDRLASALGLQVVEVFNYTRENDLIAHRFGTSATRSHRRLVVSHAGDSAMIGVAADAGPPVRGYVAFHWTQRGAIKAQRVRAENGIARHELPRREEGFAVGALIEDEGLMLEGYVEGKELVP